MKEAISSHLEAAFSAREMGLEFVVESELAYIDALDNEKFDILPTSHALTPPEEGDGMPPWLVLGCRTHGNAAIDYKSMRDLVKQAAKKNKGAMYDCSRRVLGTLDWLASE